MAKKSKPEHKDELPSAGGSYVRDPEGGLRKNEQAETQTSSDQADKKE